ncbi:MAG: UDP-N-acetylmuramoyl-L-alanine--D-glutamate ligase [bacterium]|jgi:UDP-N-acetylmuramoylalanine--D-glutamate ligase
MTSIHAALAAASAGSAARAIGAGAAGRRHAAERVAVVGLGATGVSCVRFLVRHGATVDAWDTREDPPGARELRAALPDVPMHLGPIDAAALDAADWIALSPGVPRSEPAVARALARGVPVLGDIEIFARHRHAVAPRAKTIAITGTNGKSTVTEMVGEMTRCAGLETLVAGNIGLPVLDALGEIESGGVGVGRQPQAIVLELSSFQLESTSSLGADAAAMLNLSEDHLDRYPGIVEYGAAKSRIFQGEGVQVLNRDDPASMAMHVDGRTLYSFGGGRPSSVHEWGVLPATGGDGPWLAQGDAKLMPVGELPVPGMHNVANALAALALARAIGLPYQPLLDGLRGFRGLPHRMQCIAEIDGVGFYDDSKGTNVGATVAALTGFPKPVVLIAGGDGKGQDFTPLVTVVAQAVRAVVLIGVDGERIAHALEGVAVPIERAESLESAVLRARDLARSGDAVVLSPACASYDMFRNYVHRAQVFLKAVSALVPAKSAAGEGAA